MTAPYPQPVWALTTVQLPILPLIDFDHAMRDIRKDWARELAAVNAYLDSLSILNPAQPVAQKRRRWRR